MAVQVENRLSAPKRVQLYDDEIAVEIWLQPIRDLIIMASDDDRTGCGCVNRHSDIVIIEVHAPVQVVCAVAVRPVQVRRVHEILIFRADGP